MAKKEVANNRGQDFRSKAKHFVAKGIDLGSRVIQTTAIAGRLIQAPPAPSFSPDTGNNQKAAQQLPTYKNSKDGIRNQKSEFNYTRKDGSSIAAQDKKTSLHSPPQPDMHMTGNAHSSNAVFDTSLSAGQSQIINGISLSGARHDKMVDRQAKKLEKEKNQSVLENEIASIRLLDRVALSIGLNTTPVIESLIATVGMKGADNNQILADAKSYLIESIQKDGPRAFSEMTPTQISEMTNVLKWGNWSDIMPELNDVSQRAIYQTKELGKQLSNLLSDGKSRFEDIMQFFKDVEGAFNSLPQQQKAGLITMLTLYGTGTALMIDGARRKNILEMASGFAPFILACGISSAFGSPMPPTIAPPKTSVPSADAPSAVSSPTTLPHVDITPVPSTTNQSQSEIPGINYYNDPSLGIDSQAFATNNPGYQLLYPTSAQSLRVRDYVDPSTGAVIGTNFSPDDLISIFALQQGKDGYYRGDLHGARIAFSSDLKAVVDENGKDVFPLVGPNGWGFVMLAEKNGILYFGTTDGNYKIASDLYPILGKNINAIDSMQKFIKQLDRGHIINDATLKQIASFNFSGRTLTLYDANGQALASIDYFKNDSLFALAPPPTVVPSVAPSLTPEPTTVAVNLDKPMTTEFNPTDEAGMPSTNQEMVSSGQLGDAVRQYWRTAGLINPDGTVNKPGNVIAVTSGEWNYLIAPSSNVFAGGEEFLVPKYNATKYADLKNYPYQPTNLLFKLKDGSGIIVTEALYYTDSQGVTHVTPVFFFLEQSKISSNSKNQIVQDFGHDSGQTWIAVPFAGMQQGGTTTDVSFGPFLNLTAMLNDPTQSARKNFADNVIKIQDPTGIDKFIWGAMVTQ